MYQELFSVLKTQQQIKQMESLPSWNLHMLLTHTNEWVNVLMSRCHE